MHTHSEHLMTSKTTTRLVIDSLASYRLTKLIVDDELPRELREKLLDRLYEKQDSVLAQKAAYFLTCPWCVSIYTAATVLAARKLFPRTSEAVHTALAFSAITGILEEKL